MTPTMAVAAAATLPIWVAAKFNNAADILSAALFHHLLLLIAFI
jgi:hypothetical protein